MGFDAKKVQNLGGFVGGRLDLPLHVWGEVFFFSLLLALVLHILLDRNRRL